MVDYQAKGKTIIVTGGASGAGNAVVKQLADQGCRLFIVDVQVPGDDFGADFLHCDLSDQASIDSAVGVLPQHVDALINVAGIATADPADKVVRVNFLGLRHLTDALLPRISDGGTIVNVASTAGLSWQNRAPIINALLDTPDFQSGIDWCAENENQWAKDPYTFSKQCATAYSLRAAGFARDREISCNCVSPGAIETGLTEDFKRLMGDQHDWSVAQTGRSAQPDDIADVITYLAIGPCGWLNGINIPVDRGMTAGLNAGWIDFNTSPLGKAIAAKKAAKAKG